MSAGKVVVVTGATSGFGEAIARRFVREGAKVVATGRRADRLARLKRELGARCATLNFDVRDRKAVAKAFGALPKGFDKPDIVVANAGLALGLAPAQEADLDDWDTMIAANCNGLAYTVRALLPGLVARKRGHVVLMGSVASDFPYPGGNAYGATKAFVGQFALNLRADLLGTGVRVTNIEPGLCETEFSLVRFKGDAVAAAKPYEGLKPLSADDIAETVFWSCSLPDHVNINRIQLMPTAQAFSPFAFSRKA